jgi:hypothetical protein
VLKWLFAFGLLVAAGSFAGAMLSATNAIEMADRHERDSEALGRAFERASVAQRIASVTLPAGLALSATAVVLHFVRRKRKPPDDPEG